MWVAAPRLLALILCGSGRAGLPTSEWCPVEEQGQGREPVGQTPGRPGSQSCPLRSGTIGESAKGHRANRWGSDPEGLCAGAPSTSEAKQQPRA